MRQFGMKAMAVLLPVVLVAAIASRLGAQERRAPRAATADAQLFEGKPVRIATSDVVDSNYYFESVRLATIGGKNYFVGVHADDRTDKFQRGKTIWLLQERAIEIIVFKNNKELEEILAGLPTPIPNAPAGASPFAPQEEVIPAGPDGNRRAGGVLIPSAPQAAPPVSPAAKSARRRRENPGG